jgi:hypothetical protein
VVEYYAESSSCKVFPIRVDNCTGQVLHIIEQPAVMPCELPNTTPPQHPCTSFSVTAGVGSPAPTAAGRSRHV